LEHRGIEAVAELELAIIGDAVAADDRQLQEQGAEDGEPARFGHARFADQFDGRTGGERQAQPDLAADHDLAARIGQHADGIDSGNALTTDRRGDRLGQLITGRRAGELDPGIARWQGPVRIGAVEHQGHGITRRWGELQRLAISRGSADADHAQLTARNDGRTISRQVQEDQFADQHRLDPQRRIDDRELDRVANRLRRADGADQDRRVERIENAIGIELETDRLDPIADRQDIAIEDPAGAGADVRHGQCQRAGGRNQSGPAGVQDRARLAADDHLGSVEHGGYVDHAGNGGRLNRGGGGGRQRFRRIPGRERDDTAIGQRHAIPVELEEHGRPANPADAEAGAVGNPTRPGSHRRDRELERLGDEQFVPRFELIRHAAASAIDDYEGVAIGDGAGAGGQSDQPVFVIDRDPVGTVAPPNAGEGTQRDHAAGGVVAEGIVDPFGQQTITLEQREVRARFP